MRPGAILPAGVSAILVLLLLTGGSLFAQNPTDSGNRGALEFQASPGPERNVPTRHPVDKIRNFRVYAPTKNLTTYTSEPQPMQRVDPPAATGESGREMQPAGLSVANRMRRSLPPPTIEDLERQIGALKEKIAYAGEHPGQFAESDIIKMEGALRSKIDQVTELRRAAESNAD